MPGMSAANDSPAQLHSGEAGKLEVSILTDAGTTGTHVHVAPDAQTGEMEPSMAVMLSPSHVCDAFAQILGPRC